MDDLQWADPHTLNLLVVLLTAKPSHLLLLGAYRDNEVSEDHPLMRTIKEVTEKGGRVEDILLRVLIVIVLCMFSYCYSAA